MDWDMKASSSHWDWDNMMLFPNRGADIGKKAQWENDTVAASGHPEMDNSSMQNGSFYSLGCGSGSTLAYGSSSKSSASVEFSTEAEPDLCKIKAESIESGYAENINVGFLDLRSQTDPKTTGLENGKSSKIKANSELIGFCDREQQELHGSFVGKELDKIDKTNASLTVAASSGSGGDSHIGLKLGKRTYFEDVAASNGIAIKATPSLEIPVTPSTSTKRHRGLSQSMQSPCCQVEGCNADLSSVKDYHKRHKVCQAHSKSSMVIVNNQKQRFCQQCSRFHVLSEFDDGKRSCRRRLAGHNERRRKPQPDSIALNSSRLGSSFYDSSRTGLLMDRSSFMPPRIFSSSVLDSYNDFKLGHGNKGFWPRIIKTEDQLIFNGQLQTPGVNQQTYLNAVSPPPAEKRYMLLQSSKAASDDVPSQGIHNYTWNQTNPATQALTLSSSSGMEVPGGLEIDSATGMLSGVSIQSRALSLLSSQSRSSRAPGSSSLDLAPRPGFALEQFMHQNDSPMTQIPVPGMQHNFSPVTDKFLSISSQPSTGLVSNGYPEPGASSLDKVSQGGSLIPNMGGIGNFEGPFHDLLRQEMISHDSRSKGVRPTIDLMRRSSQAQSNESQERSDIGQHGNRHFMEFQLMRCYDTSVLDSQHMQ